MLLQLTGPNSNKYCDMAIASYQAGVFDQAWLAFGNALLLNDSSEMADVWYNVGTAALQTCELEMAVRSFRVAISLGLSDEKLWRNLSQAYKLRRQFGEAEECLVKVCRKR